MLQRPQGRNYKRDALRGVRVELSKMHAAAAIPVLHFCATRASSMASVRGSMLVDPRDNEQRIPRPPFVEGGQRVRFA
jgi:hypothetical protein